MGLFNRTARADEATAPLVRGDGETSFTVTGGGAWAFRKVLAARDGALPKVGAHSERFDVALRRQRLGAVLVSCDGYPLGQVSAEDAELVRRSMDFAQNQVIRAGAYVWRAQDRSLGLRVYLPAKPRQ